MRCAAATRQGRPCARRALADAPVCASHAGRCGARPGNRNGLRHGLYSRQLPPEERLDLALARATEGLDDEIAMTRLMILRVVREQDPSPATYTRLIEALCSQLRIQRQLGGAGANALADALGRLLEEIADSMGLAK